jgi:hypothetical protein
MKKSPEEGRQNYTKVSFPKDHNQKFHEEICELESRPTS